MTTSTSHQKGAERDGLAAIDPRIRRRLERIWDQAYAAETQDDLRDLYAEWSESYDEDHAAIGYFGHRTTAEVFAARFDDPGSAEVLDAGAGPGAGGVELARRGFRRLTALDLS
ncbi:MAG: hypothetical protein MI919_32755 [Holophagales bacterium]|nr:hypothetical protein [Holophagales bacterium]